MPNIALTLKRTIAQMANIQHHEVEMAKGLSDYGLDSLTLLILRETCERQFGVYISDSAWTELRTIGQLEQWLEKEVGTLHSADGASTSAPAGSGSEPPSKSGRKRGYWETDDFRDEIEIGMPFTGINNLSENSLLKYLGDLRWAHLSDLAGVPSRQIADADGNRLYATFFYVEVAFPEHRPMAASIENDRLLLVSRLKRFGESMLDGVTFLLPPDTASSAQPALSTIADAQAKDVPAVRLSNIFVQQFSGAEWLKKSRPANPGFRNIRELPVAPDSYEAVKTADKAGYFYLPESSYVKLLDNAVTQYKLIPERDVNGAGLLYFANYPVFLDMSERQVLLQAARPMNDDLCNRRTVSRRKSAYLNNASWKDTLRIETEAWVQNPFTINREAPELAPIRLFSNQKMYRESDGRLMMVSTSEKLIFGRAAEDLPFFSEFSSLTP